MRRITWLAFFASILCLGAVMASTWPTPVSAQDKLKVAVGQRGVWENSISELGNDAGIFGKHGLALEVFYTQGAGETQQAVIAGSAEIGIGVGAHGVLGAFSKGAPVRVLGATMTGSYEFWYVRAESPIQNFKDAAGKTVAYSTTGSSTNMLVLALQKHYGVSAQIVATGSPSATLTQVLSGQVDVGWTAPPTVLQQVQEGKVRIVARGKDAPEGQNQTVRFVIANAGAFERNKQMFARYMQAYRETLDWLYSNPAALPAYAKWARVSEDIAKRMRDDFVPKANADPDKIVGMETIMDDAVKFKFIAAPLTKEQLTQLIQIPAK